MISCNEFFESVGIEVTPEPEQPESDYEWTPEEGRTLKPEVQHKEDWRTMRFGD